jgi:hypothetical protein
VDWEVLPSGTSGQVLTTKADGSIGWSINAALAAESANLVLAGPASGAAAVPTFRALTAADVPAFPQFLTSGLYYFTYPSQTIIATTIANGSLRLTPFLVPRPVTLLRIGAEVTSVGSTGAVVRLGIFADNGSGQPSTLVLDAGTIDGTSATVQEIVISQALAPGLYWVGAVTQGSPSTLPTVRVMNDQTMQLIGQATIPAAGAFFSCYYLNSVTGALASISSLGGVTASGYRTFVKVQ